jgi:signal transduction histidine kinase
MMADEISATAYRVVVEALTNVRQHARGASGVDVTLTITQGGLLRVTVVNDGVAGGAGRHRRSGGLGIVGLRERVELLGGTLTAEPLPADGWRLEVVLPK